MRDVWYRTVRTRRQEPVPEWHYPFPQKAQIVTARGIETTAEEAIAELTSICAMKVQANKQAAYHTIPKPRFLGELFLKKAGVVLPTILSCKNTIVATRKKLLS